MNNILVAAAGTGGHVLPAYRFAKHAKTSGNKIIWIGGRREIERKYAAKVNADFYSLGATGVRGKNIFESSRAIFNLGFSTVACIFNFIKTKPDIIVVFGGYISIPVGIAAIILRKKLFTHEQNTVLGTANKFLSKFANINFLGLPLHHESVSRAKLVGNPVDVLTQKDKPKDTNKLNIYVTGGSLGSAFINTNIPSLLSQYSEKIQIIHQSGIGNSDIVKENYKPFKNVEISEYIEDPLTTMQNSDFVISRAGALTLSELLIIGRGGIIIPLPSAIDNHQFFNAEYFCGIGMGFIFQEHEDINKLKNILDELILNEGFRKFNVDAEDKNTAEKKMLESILDYGK